MALNVNQTIEQAIVVSQSDFRENQNTTVISLFNADGTPYTGSTPAASTTTAGVVKKLPAQVDSVAADAATLKTDFNSLLAKLRTAGILTP